MMMLPGEKSSDYCKNLNILEQTGSANSADINQGLLCLLVVQLNL